MFRCQICEGVVPKGTPTHKIVTKTREKNYAPRGTSLSEQRFRNRRSRGRSKKTQNYDKGGSGTEIVEELTVCRKCATEFTAANAES